MVIWGGSEDCNVILTRRTWYLGEVRKRWSSIPLGLPGGGRPAGCSGQFANMDIEETSPKDIG